MARQSSRHVPWLLLVLSLSATVGVTWRFREMREEREEARFEEDVDEACDAIRGRVDTYLTLLFATRSLVASHGEITGDEFHQYAEALQLGTRYRGLYGLSWVARIRRDEVPQLEARRRAEGAADFHVWPPPTADESFPLVYFEPGQLPSGLGFDVGSEPLRREALFRSRDSGEPAATDPVQLLKQVDPAQPTAFIIALAVYRGKPITVEERRAQLLGFVQCGFQAGVLFPTIFSTIKDSLAITVADEGRLLHSSHDDADAAGAKPSYQTQRRLPVAGRHWTLSFRTRPAFDAHSSPNESAYVMWSGLLFSVVLFAVSRNQVRARATAEDHRTRLQVAHREARDAETAAQQQRERLHALFMQAPVAIAIQEGPDHVYTLANPSYRQFLANRELVGKPVREVLPEVARLNQILAEVHRSRKTWEGREQVFKVDRGDGNWVEGFFNLICQPELGADGAVSGIITFGFEVTDLVRARKEKEALATDFEAAVRVRDTFLAIASHELRTPLTTLQLQSDGLLRALDRPPVDVEKVRHRAAKIQLQALRLNRLISDLLDVSRITAGRLRLDLELVDLKTLVEEALGRTEEALQRAACHVEVSAPQSVMGRWDRQRLDQVVTNLLTNAAKYGAGKPVQVTVSGDGERARLTVRDQGIGIDPADQARIFERFERAVSERNFGGLGLGLWISEQIVSAHGGSIRVESRPGEGSTFTVELPQKV